MLELKKGVDILGEIGGIKTSEEAEAILAKNLDQVNLDKLSKIKNEEARIKIANAITM